MQAYYQNFAADTTQIESYLSKRLAEFLNAEIVLNTIRDTGTTLKKWIRTTFFYVRIMKSATRQQADAHINGMLIFEFFCNPLSKWKIPPIFFYSILNCMIKFDISIKTNTKLFSNLRRARKKNSVYNENESIKIVILPVIVS